MQSVPVLAQDTCSLSQKPNSVIIQIETARIQIKSLRIEHLESIESFYISDPKMAKSYGIPGFKIKTFIQSKLRIRTWLGIWERESNQLIGFICFRTVNGETVLSYALDPKFQSRGLMTEALQAVLPKMLENVVEIKAETNIGNEISQRLLLRVGFQKIQGDDPQRVSFVLKR